MRVFVVGATGAIGTRQSVRRGGPVRVQNAFTELYAALDSLVPVTRDPGQPGPTRTRRAEEGDRR